MPQVVGAWIISAVGGVAAVGATGAALIQAGVALAFNYAVGKIFAPKGPRPQDLQNEIRQADAPRVRFLGRNRVAGVVHFWEWAPVSGKRVLYKLLAVAEGGFTQIEGYWLNDVSVQVAGSGVTTGPWAGSVRLTSRTGTDAEINGGAYPQLQAGFAQWTYQHKLTGVGTVLAEFDAVSGEDIAKVYSGGEPKVQVMIKGAPVWNPDLGSANYTNNLAAHVRDIFTHPDYGCMGLADIYNGSFSEAFGVCQQTVPTKGGGTMPRYVGGGAYSLSEPVKDVAQRWLDAMAGSIYLTVDGRVGIRAGVWRAPNYTITDEHIVSMDGGSGSGQFEVLTTLVPKYTAPEIGWQETQADPWDDPVALARYGEVVPKEIPLPVVQHHGQARRVAKIKAAKMNPKWRFNLRLRFWGLLLIEEDNVYLHLPRRGIVNQPFWIDSYEFDPETGTVAVSLIHARPDSFAWTAAEEGEPPATPTPITEQPPPDPPVITSVTVLNNRAIEPYIRVAYTAPALFSVVGQTRETGSTDEWTEMIREGQGGTLRSVPLPDGQYDVRLALRQAGWSLKNASPWVTQAGITVLRYPTAPTAPVLVSSTLTGTQVSIKFRPQLGSNYSRTDLYRTAPGASSSTGGTLVATSYDLTSPVTLNTTLPGAGAKYWLVSINGSNVPSPVVAAGNYPAP